MKRTTLCLLFLLVTTLGFTQNYNPVINYAYNGTPTYGVKIKTKLPYTNGTQMPTITIEGYNYGSSKPIGLNLVWYIYDGIFWYPKISSWGAYTPMVKLANENGFVSIFIDDRQYYNRFTVRAYANGMDEIPSWFANWSIVDEPISGTNIVTVPYANAFAGNITFPNGVWNEDGNVGIGVFSPKNRLDVNGTIRAKEVKVESGWADFVFKPDYQLKPLAEVEQFITANGHLPEIPTAKEVEQNGVSLGKMNAKLLQKVEELTLYIINQNKRIDSLIIENKKHLKINHK
ncbi:hypothetical protein [uncultured Acetobacteroides sp.]|uniref:hypothetical protein n=1 Tax=uncultured Acetobacteroides sp. TaxID=1760811 RepID=UPI0029F536B4|nr:hypothetical protein [uncultured Acetobacteroides sp.]